MRTFPALVTSLAIASALVSGCKGSSPSGAGGGAAVGAVTVDDAARTEAKNIFATRCLVCHGPKGEGNGPASAGLNPKPRNFTDKGWQGTVTDDHVEKIIQYGGAAVGKSPAMPPNPDLVAKPAVIAALREHVRGLSQ